MPIAIPIPELPSLHRQVMQYHDHMGRGYTPPKVEAVDAARKRPPSVAERVLRLIKRHGTQSRQDLIGALHETPIANIDNAIWVLVKHKKIQRRGKGIFVAIDAPTPPPRPRKTSIKDDILGVIDRGGSATRQELIGALPARKPVSVLTAMKRLLSDRVIERCGPARYRRTRAIA